MTGHKSNRRTLRIAAAVTAVIAVGAAALATNYQQFMAVAEETLDIVKTVTYLSAGRIPNAEPVPNSSDELDNTATIDTANTAVLPPSADKSYIFKDMESSDEGFAIETREIADTRPVTEEETQESTEVEAAVPEQSGELHIRSNIEVFDDGLDYSAEGVMSGRIARYTYTATQDPTFITLDSGAQVRNCTWVTNEALTAESKLLPEFKIQLNGEPQVLIMHTHTTESYEPYERSYYDADFPFRSRESEHNVVAVGEKIAEQLAASGIAVIHDGTVHDYPSYNGAYVRSEATVREYLEKYPSIKVVLDVHRDALESEDGVRIAPVAEIEGKKAAQIMIISGCDDGTFGMPNYMQNFRLACLFQNKLAQCEQLPRAVLFDYRKYNQHLTTGSLLLEIGGHANSLDEALYCGELAGKSIAQALLSIAEE